MKGSPWADSYEYEKTHSGHASEWSNLTETQESLDDVVLVEAERNVTGLLNQVCNS